jgi:hypothetical protein
MSAQTQFQMDSQVQHQTSRLQVLPDFQMKNYDRESAFSKHIEVELL